MSRHRVVTMVEPTDSGARRRAGTRGSSSAGKKPFGGSWARLSSPHREFGFSRKADVFELGKLKNLNARAIAARMSSFGSPDTACGMTRRSRQHRLRDRLVTAPPLRTVVPRHSE